MNQYLKTASEAFLTVPLPDNWDDMEEQEQNIFLTDQAWEPIMHYSPDEIWACIEAHADTIQQAHGDLLEACERAYKALEGISMSDTEYQSVPWHLITSAITKAKGE